MCSRNKRGTAWSRNVSRSCFWDCNWGRTGHGQLLVNSFPCLYLVTVPEVFAKVTRPSFLPSKVLNDSSALQFFKFFDSYFGRSFLPAPPPLSDLFLYSPTAGGRLCSAHFTISQADWWSYPKEADEVELCVWSPSLTLHMGIQQYFLCFKLFLVSTMLQTII